MNMTQSGILLIDKPEGPSSAQVVHRVKSLLGAKKVGHMGTLDPFASGLLLLGVNEGTKVADIFLGSIKSYRAVMVLGVVTDSQDATGNVVQVRAVPFIGDDDLRALEKKFSGDLQQVPPMFSALKKEGVRLYHLARQGKEVPREPRRVTIERLALDRLDDTTIAFEVTCSHGTYVRTLAADMGEFLGCGAHLQNLRRTACGHLSVNQAITMDEFEQANTRHEIPLIPLHSALSHLRAMTWDNPWITKLRLGQQDILDQIGKPQPGEKWVRVMDLRGEMVALVEWHEEIPAGRWRLARVIRA